MQGMADKHEQSREVDVLMDVFKDIVRENKVERINGAERESDGITLYIDGKPFRLYVDKSPKTTLKVNVDVSEALVGLKAIQREAREATKALRELEEAQRNTVADDIRRSYE